MITFDQFYTKYNNKPVNVDHQYGNQCWDLVAAYNEEVIGVPASADYGLPTGPDLDAKDVYLYFENPLPQYFDKLPVSTAPQKGDLVVWGFAPDGHISIFIKGTLSNFDSFDQNWPVGSFAHLQNHNGNNILGFLRPKGGDVAVPTIDVGGVNALFYAFLGRPPEAQDASNIGRPWQDVVYDLAVSQEHKDYLAKIQKALGDEANLSGAQAEIDKIKAIIDS